MLDDEEDDGEKKKLKKAIFLLMFTFYVLPHSTCVLSLKLFCPSSYRLVIPDWIAHAILVLIRTAVRCDNNSGRNLKLTHATTLMQKDSKINGKIG